MYIHISVEIIHDSDMPLYSVLAVKLYCIFILSTMVINFDIARKFINIPHTNTHTHVVMIMAIYSLLFIGKIGLKRQLNLQSNLSSYNSTPLLRY